MTDYKFADRRSRRPAPTELTPFVGVASYKYLAPTEPGFSDHGARLPQSPINRYYRCGSQTFVTSVHAFQRLGYFSRVDFAEVRAQN